MKPTVFIGSSSEAAGIADLLTAEIGSVAVPIPWNRNDLFAPGTYVIPELQEHIRNSDFALFVLSPDDLTIERDELFTTARDNVLIELGLFTQSLGLQRAFALLGQSVKVPSDLKGLNVLFYDDSLAQTKRAEALQDACAKIRLRITELGIRYDRDIDPYPALFDKWQTPSGGWLANGESIVLGDYPDPANAAYAWSPQELRVGAAIEFDMTIDHRVSRQPVYDFRVAMFSASRNAGQDASHHLILAPWGGEKNAEVDGGSDIRVDYMAAGMGIHRLVSPLDKKFIAGHPYTYKVVTRSNRVEISIDEELRLIYPLDVKQALRKGTHWGFAAEKAAVTVRNLKTNL